ncbi:FHA domain-containing protein [Actinoplanes sp. NEAU-A12]|uniref:FHA domain-containing protein n=1 Tax=Actinoplanes sandaracinus TaxID=3045177 RepID=A0ABT6X0S7_9ACTN|nr:FHA domain-containing protein [Actinoplanes sandaracinus]MDI6105456.1 FHA domain-containing protein [Actinoplanes sandaracinus]
MTPEIVGREGPLAGRRFPFGETPLTFGRRPDNGVVLSGSCASRRHAEISRESDGYVLRDHNSSNGTLVNGRRVTARVLQPGDLITIGQEIFCFEMADQMDTVLGLPAVLPAGIAPVPALRVTISGGGPVGLTLALLLTRLMGERVQVTVYDGRWTRAGSRVVWKDESQGNNRRQQVVTLQSRQYLNLPEEVQAHLFDAGSYSEMWPAGPDSIRGYGPRNVRIAYIEDKLLELANTKPQHITLVPERFDLDERRDTVLQDHVLAICEGGRSRTRERLVHKFGNPDTSIYSIDGEHLQDVVLGLRVKSGLTDSMSVLLTVAQNRFLLNSLRGEGFLNMRLTDAEAQEVVGIDPVRRVFEDCIASRPCVMARDTEGDFVCPTHQTLFLPSLIKRSALWQQVLEGLRYFGVAEENLSAVTAFRLDMVQRPKFTAQLYPATAETPGTYAFLLGDAANAIHFWPGRGLNSGLASAISLARSLGNSRTGRALRDADFIRHEAAMSMLQYRHKSRAWKAMVTTDEQGVTHAIKDEIAESMANAAGRAADGDADKEAAVDELMDRLRLIRSRLTSRIPDLPDDTALRDHLQKMQGATVRALLASGPWDTANVGGEEVDIDIFYRPEPSGGVAKVMSGAE